jgi:hypothetical protein
LFLILIKSLSFADDCYKTEVDIHNRSLSSLDTNIQIAVVSNSSTNSNSNCNTTSSDSSKSSSSDTSFEAEKSVGEECDSASFSPTYVYSGTFTWVAEWEGWVAKLEGWMAK